MIGSIVSQTVVPTVVTVVTTDPSVTADGQSNLPQTTLVPNENVAPVSSPNTIPTGSEVKAAITTMEDALVAYDKVLKQCAQWRNFLEQVPHPRTRAFSSRSGQLMGEITTLLLNLDSEYFQATQPMYAWCGESIPLLDGYAFLMSNRKIDVQERREGQRELLLEVLKTDVEQSNIALNRLEQAFSTLNTATNKLYSLALQLHDDFSEGSEHFENELKADQQKASKNLTIMGLATRAIKFTLQKLGPMIGTIAPQLQTVINKIPMLNSTNDASQDTAAAKLKAEFADIYNFCSNLWTEMDKQAKTDFDQIRNELRSKIEAIESAKDRIGNTAFGDQRQTQPVSSAINSLKTRCRRYRSTFRNTE